MLLTLLQFFATKFLVLALHLEAGSFPKPLSAREEVETFAALRAGDPTARETLIRHNLRLVVHVVKKYYAQPSDQEDLISIGTIGLMKAVDTFDSTRKARFSTYASRCIENAILTRTNAGRRIGTISTAIGGILVLFRVYREGGPVDLILWRTEEHHMRHLAVPHHLAYHRADGSTLLGHGHIVDVVVKHGQQLTHQVKFHPCQSP